MPSLMRMVNFRLSYNARRVALALAVILVLGFLLLPGQLQTVFQVVGSPFGWIISWPLHAVAGIGNPDRFFRLLRGAGMKVIEHSFPDHHRYQPGDFPWHDGVIVMTEKDAVKCSAFAREGMWFVAVQAQFDSAFEAALFRVMERPVAGAKHG